MKGILFHICVIASVLLLSGCNRKLTSQDIAEQYTSGVAVIQNRYYYKVQLEGGHTFWFVPSDDAMTDIQFYTDENEVKQKARTAYGTGFFITDDGVLVANSEVVNPPVNTNDVCRSLSNQLVYLKNYYSSNLELYKRRLELVGDAFKTLADERLEALSYIKGNLQMRTQLEKDYVDRKNKLTAMQTDFQHKTDSLSGVLKELEHFNNTQVSVYPVQQLSIAYWQPDKKAYSSYVPCLLRASNAKNGLAVAQLDGKRTPDDCYVFELPGNSIFADWFKKNELPSMLYIPGVKGDYANPAKISPFVSGTSAKPDKNHLHIAYGRDIEGNNNGSPVLDTSGTLVGVNVTNNTGAYCLKIEELFQLVKIKTN